jgi:hypothetical protein
MAHLLGVVPTSTRGPCPDLFGGQHITHRVSHVKRELHDVLELGVANYKFLTDTKLDLDSKERGVLLLNMLDLYRHALAIFFELNEAGVDSELSQFFRREPEFLAMISKFYTGTAYESEIAFAREFRLQFNKFMVSQFRK